jgi:hypothetical protein
MALEPGGDVLDPGDKTGIIRNSYFAHYALKRLRKGEPLSATELFEEVRRSVAEISKGKMTPQFRYLQVEDGEFVFVPAGMPPEERERAIDQMNLRHLERGAQRVTYEELQLVLQVTSNYRYAFDAEAQERVWRGRFERYVRNAELGDPAAMCCLYTCYAHGLGVEQDDKAARVWAERAFEQGDPHGKLVLGVCYEDGRGGPANAVVAEKLLREAAEAGCALSEALLAMKLGNKSLTPSGVTDEEKAQVFTWLHHAVEQNIACAKDYLGYLYLHGLLGVPKDPQRGGALLLEAARQGFLPSQDAVATMYMEGQPWEGAPALDGKQMLLEAAKAGYRRAQLRLGLYYYQGKEGIERDYASALEWLKMAAAQSERIASYKLGLMYLNGEGTKVDREQAVKYFDEAIKLGYAPAMVAKGRMLLDGTFLKQDAEEALVLFNRAADQGDTDGLYYSGMRLVKKGENSTSPDQHHMVIEGAVRLLQAQEAGHARAAEEIKKLQKHFQEHPEVHARDWDKVNAEFQRRKRANKANPSAEKD